MHKWAPVVPVVEVDAKGEDNAWYILPVYCCCAYPLDEYSSVHVDPVPDYVENMREDPITDPQRDDLPANGSDDKMWAELGVLAWRCVEE